MMSKEEKRQYRKEYYHKNGDRLRAYNRLRSQTIPEVKEKQKSRRLRCIDSWVGFIPPTTNCQVCNRVIYFKGKRSDTINFDHKHENCAIQISPTKWLENKMRTPENQKIWESCDFGHLCTVCNQFLPTKDRKGWLKKVIFYVEKNP